MARPRRAASLSAPRFVAAPCRGSPAQTSPHLETVIRRAGPRTSSPTLPFQWTEASPRRREPSAALGDLHGLKLRAQPLISRVRTERYGKTPRVEAKRLALGVVVLRCPCSALHLGQLTSGWLVLLHRDVLAWRGRPRPPCTYWKKPCPKRTRVASNSGMRSCFESRASCCGKSADPRRTQLSLRGLVGAECPQKAACCVHSRSPGPKVQSSRSCEQP